MFKLLSFLKELRKKREQKKLLEKPERTLQRFIARYPNYKIGKNCYGVPEIKFAHPDASLTIGSYCSIAKNVQIFLGGNHRTDWISTYPFPAFLETAMHVKDHETSKGSVVIGSDVWLCQNSTILSGVNIGHGAVVANGAIVTKNVAPYSIVAGNPAKHIRWRFDEKTRNALLESAWWNWPQEEIEKVAPLLCSRNIEEFINYAKSRELTN